jgi:hypothetical protein
MNNEIKTDVKEENKSYKCQICNKEVSNPVDAMTHYIDHGSSALAAINALIKDQKIGRVSIEDRARITTTDKSKTSKETEAMTAQV